MGPESLERVARKTAKNDAVKNIKQQGNNIAATLPYLTHLF